MGKIRHGSKLIASTRCRKLPSIRRIRVPTSLFYNNINLTNMLQKSGESRSFFCRNATSATTTTSSSHQSTLLDQIRSLDKSSELAIQYTPLIIFHPTSWGISNNDTTSYVVVGHAHTSLIDSALLHCTNEEGEPIFVRDRLKNRLGIMNDVLRLHLDVQLEKKTCCKYNHEEYFSKRTAAFEHVTDYLLSSGITTRKHSDVYPICSFAEMSSTDNQANLSNLT